MLVSYYTAWCLDGLGLAIQLVTKALDIVESVGNHNDIRTEKPFYCRIFRSPSVFLRLGLFIHISFYTKGLVIHMMHRHLSDFGVLRAIDPRFKGFYKLR